MQGYLDMLRREQRRYASTSATTWVNPSALEQYDLGGVDCPDCGNTGYILERGEGILEVHSYECWCMKRRRTLRALRKAGMEDMAQRCTLESYRTDTPQCAAIAEAARRFIAADSGWFFIAGQSGSGKTHICTAICTGLMEQKGKEIDFMPWRDEARTLKAAGDPVRCDTRIRRLRSVPVLYIDDLFKGGASEADLRLAFEILNGRYNDTRLRTVISSELDLEAILRLDEAVGGRIYERSNGFTVRAPAVNRRLRRTGQKTPPPDGSGV